MPCYVLLIHLLVHARITIGRLGTFEFPAGFYLYVGRAKKNIHSRVKRHRRKEKKFHWHIDYFLHHAEVADVLLIPGDDECAIARFLSARPECIIPAVGFGSSDCRCSAHFFHLYTDSKHFWEILKITHIKKS